MKLTDYLRSLVRAGTMDSSKSFALVVSAVVGAALGLTVCFCLCWDVCTNGHVETDLDALGWFVLAVGGFMAGGGVGKALSERKRNNVKPINKVGKDESSD